MEQDNKITRIWKNVSESLFTAILVIVVIVGVVPFVVNAGIRFEDAYFPVVRNVEIHTINESQRGNTVISGKFERVRACEIDHVEWSLSDPVSGYSVPIPIYRPHQMVRPLGTNTFKDVVLFARPDDIKYNAKAIGFYKCHPFWTTQTTIYDARNKIGKYIND